MRERKMPSVYERGRKAVCILKIEKISIFYVLTSVKLVSVSVAISHLVTDGILGECRRASFLVWAYEESFPSVKPVTDRPEK